MYYHDNHRYVENLFILNLNRSENKILNTFQCPCDIIVKFKMIIYD